MRLIDADELKKYSYRTDWNVPVVDVEDIDNAPTLCVENNKVVELFNKYDILLVHVDGKIVPVKNSSKQQCYDLLYEIQELIEWRKILFIKHLSEVNNDDD